MATEGYGNGDRLTPRALRLWHWRELIVARAKANQYIPRGSEFQEERYVHYSMIGNFHLKAVQVLNDAEDCRKTTAEQDDAAGMFPPAVSAGHPTNG